MAFVNRIAFAVSLVFACACSSDADSDEPRELGCDVSTAQSGDLCQVNFVCDGAEGPAMYCSEDGACACGPAVENPKQVMIPGICAMDRLEAGRAANERCEFGL